MHYPKALFPIVALVVTSAAAADLSRYSDSAPVVKVEPIMERGYETIRQHECAPTASDMPLLPTARNIGEDIRRQQRLTQVERECHWVERRQAVEHIKGYRVTYRYGGRRYMQIMKQPPGERIPVTIALEPLAR